MKEAVIVSPYMGDAHAKVGEAYLRLGLNHESLQAFRVALRLNPKLAEAHLGLGKIYLSLRKSSPALREYQAALALNSQLMEAHAGLGDAFTLEGRYQEAIEAYRMALRLIHKACLRGERHAAQDELLQAIIQFRDALNLGPEVLLPDAETGKLIALPSRTADERRQRERFLIRMPVDVREGPAIYSPALTLNVSQQGLLLETSRALPVGTQVEIITPLMEQDRKIVVPARVVRLEKKDSGEHYRLGLELLSDRADTRDWENFVKA